MKSILKLYNSLRGYIHGRIIVMRYKKRLDALASFMHDKQFQKRALLELPFMVMATPIDNRDCFFKQYDELIVAFYNFSPQGIAMSVVGQKGAVTTELPWPMVGEDTLGQYIVSGIVDYQFKSELGQFDRSRLH